MSCSGQLKKNYYYSFTDNNFGKKGVIYLGGNPPPLPDKIRKVVIEVFPKISGKSMNNTSLSDPYHLVLQIPDD